MHKCAKENKFGEQIEHIQKVKIYVKMCISDWLRKYRDTEKWKSLHVKWTSWVKCMAENKKSCKQIMTMEYWREMTQGWGMEYH